MKIAKIKVKQFVNESENEKLLSTREKTFILGGYDGGDDNEITFKNCLRPDCRAENKDCRVVCW